MDGRQLTVLIGSLRNPVFTNLFFISLILFHLSPCFCEDAIDEFKACGIVYSCGDLTNISYPFWGNQRQGTCGRPEFELKCEDDGTTTVEINSMAYRVLKMNQLDHRMRIARSDLFNDLCQPENYTETHTLDGRLFIYSLNDFNITMCCDCPCQYRNPAMEVFRCELNATNGLERTNYFSTEPVMGVCAGIIILVSIIIFFMRLQFHKKRNAPSFLPKSTPPNPSDAIWIFKIIICGFICCDVYNLKRISNQEKEIEKIRHQIKQYSYLEVKKITKSFQNKLGRGGFSTVYKGSLLDGREVAVKLLNESKGNGQDFINEVVSITKTSHVNVIALLRFCFEWNKRALIFEYMPRGSLDNYIFHRGLVNNDDELNWNTLYNIIVGVARGLNYLHRGCNTRIHHFDIKPHNILLDNDFCPKISDFGLAKQCKLKDTHVSMTGVKGTVGFIAPEMIFRKYGKVAHKSDVYSYGMLILEMVGERKNPNEGMAESSDECFPDWIYKNLTVHAKEGSFCWANTEEEEDIARKMVMVGLHCIQTRADDRPSMSEVVSMLEESVDCLQMPPKPTLFALPMLPQDSSSSASLLRK